MKYKVKLSYPTIIAIDGKEYVLFPGQAVELPDAEVIKTYEGLGYIEKLHENAKKTKKEVIDAS